MIEKIEFAYIAAIGIPADHFFQQRCLSFGGEIIAFNVRQLVKNSFFLAFSANVFIYDDGIAAIVVFMCQCPYMKGHFLINKYNVQCIIPFY